MKRTLIAVLLFASAIGTTACNSSLTEAKFIQADVAKAQEQITNEFQNRGFEVEQINLIKESDRRLSGYVRIRKASGLIRPQRPRIALQR